MHELGHALGLSHPGDYNAGVGVVITYANSAQFIQDSEMYSVMSYFAGSNTGENPGAFATAYTPLLLDIYEIQNLYGANTTTRVGNTTYGFNATSDALASYSFAGKTAPQFCIWDAAGVDTLDCSGYSGAQNISLVAGTFSSVDGLTNNVSIALGCSVENAIGGSGADTIIANSSQNSLTGGLGADLFKYFATTDSTLAARDRILDFTKGQDILDLSMLDANVSLAGDQAFAFNGALAFTAAGQLRCTYDANLGQTLVEANADANTATVEFSVALIGNVSIAATDLIL
jgi:serralysin